MTFPRSASALRFFHSFYFAFLIIGLGACAKKETVLEPSAKTQPIISKRIRSGFDTHWSTETQFIVESTIIDLAGMAYYARHGHAIASDQLEVDAREIPPSDEKPLTYRLSIRCPDFAIESNLPVTGSIWNPAMYRQIVDLLFGKLEIDPVKLPPEDEVGHASLRELTAPTAAVIERENGVISSALKEHFLSPSRHEQAALLLAAFTLRDHSGLFYEIRSELCRMTAHLAFAQALSRNAPASTEGKLAAAAQAMFYNDQRTALRELDAIPTSDPVAEAWVRALRIRTTGDYRLASGLKNPSLLERLEEFTARVNLIDPTLANRTLPAGDEIRSLSDWCRILNESNPGVEIGHEILARSLKDEISEAGQVYQLALGKELSQATFIEKLNVEPGPCVIGSDSNTTEVHIIGWGLWAAFLQRHLCLAMQSDFAFMQHRWGVPEEAQKYREYIDQHFSGLRLYPFVRRQNSTEESYYHQAQDAEMVVVHHSPHLVPVAVWNEICYKMSFAALYIPPPHAYINEWHRFNPLPGTAMGIEARIRHPSMTNRKDYGQLLARLHEMAPYDSAISHYYLYQKASPDGQSAPDGPSMEQGYAAILEYDPSLMARLAEVYKQEPDLYERWMTKASDIAPSWNYSLGKFYAAEGRDSDAAHAYEKIVFDDTDAVRMSQHCLWLVRYYENTGAAGKATALAERAAEVYSSGGLETMAWLLEKRGDFSGAIQYCQKIQERYDNPAALISCLLRYERAKGKTDYSPQLRELMQKSLPRGLEKITPAMLVSPPKAGTYFKSENAETRKVGVRSTDIVIGIRGYKVETSAEYYVVRDMEPDTPFKLQVWRDGHYLELSASPPNNRFGVDMGDYIVR